MPPVGTGEQRFVITYENAIGQLEQERLRIVEVDQPASYGLPGIGDGGESALAEWLSDPANQEKWVVFRVEDGVSSQSHATMDVGVRTGRRLLKVSTIKSPIIKDEGAS